MMKEWCTEAKPTMTNLQWTVMTVFPALCAIVASTLCGGPFCTLYFDDFISLWQLVWQCHWYQPVASSTRGCFDMFWHVAFWHSWFWIMFAFASALAGHVSENCAQGRDHHQVRKEPFLSPWVPIDRRQWNRSLNEMVVKLGHWSRTHPCCLLPRYGDEGDNFYIATPACFKLQLLVVSWCRASDTLQISPNHVRERSPYRWIQVSQSDAINKGSPSSTKKNT